jgi:hypothetical protein
MVNSAHHHQLDGLPGSYMRSAGWPEWPLIGSVTQGTTDPPLGGPRTGYAVLAPEHPVFHHPRQIDTTALVGTDAIGYEVDVSCRTSLRLYGGPHSAHYPARDGSPDPDLATDFDAGQIVLGRGVIPRHQILTYDNDWGYGDFTAEMTFWERPGRGAVFTTGSVLSCHSLLTDRNFSNLLRNVLDRMGAD